LHDLVELHAVVERLISDVPAVLCHQGSQQFANSRLADVLDAVAGCQYHAAEPGVRATCVVGRGFGAIEVRIRSRTVVVKDFPE
jgi:hypothetical protein